VGINALLRQGDTMSQVTTLYEQAGWLAFVYLPAILMPKRPNPCNKLRFTSRWFGS
jgi:hypothetical protein